MQFVVAASVSTDVAGSGQTVALGVGELLCPVPLQILEKNQEEAYVQAKLKIVAVNSTAVDKMTDKVHSALTVDFSEYGS